MKEKTKVVSAFYYPTEEQKKEIEYLAKKFGISVSKFVLLKALGKI